MMRTSYCCGGLDWWRECVGLVGVFVGGSNAFCFLIHIRDFIGSEGAEVLISLVSNSLISLEAIDLDSILVIFLGTL
jgi:hypothetical protein